MAAPRSLLTWGFEQVQSLACLCLLAIALNRAFRWIFFYPLAWVDIIRDISPLRLFNIYTDFVNR